MAYNQSNQIGSFVATTDIYDVPEGQEKELIIRLYQNLNRMALVLNTSTKGYYDTAGSFVNGSLWFPNPALNSSTSPARTPAYRQEERVVLNLPKNGSGYALPATTTITIAHNIICTTMTTFTDLHGMASDTTNFYYYPINYAGSSTISTYADGTNVYVTNNTAVNFTVCYVVIEFLQT